MVEMMKYFHCGPNCPVNSKELSRPGKGIFFGVASLYYVPISHRLVEVSYS